MADNTMYDSSWNAGDGYSYPAYLNPDDSSNYTVPLYGTAAYQGNSNNSLLYTNSADYLGAVPNYYSGDSASSFDTGGSNALGTLGGTLGGMGNVAGAIGGGVGAIANAYNGASTDTTGSVLSGVASGAATGAEIGSIVPGIGTAFGAVAGGIIGGLAGLFGSKSKKKAEQQAFQQKEQLAVLPYQQEQANYLQKQGLLQQAIGNYRSAFTPGGYSFTNGLLNNTATNKGYGIPTQAPSLPNFNQAPPNVVPGTGNNSLGIKGYSLPNNGVNLNPGAIQVPGNGYTGTATNPYYGFTQPAPAQAPTAPGFVKDPNAQNAAISGYQQQYQQFVQQQNQQMDAAAMQGYQPYFTPQASYSGVGYI